VDALQLEFKITAMIYGQRVEILHCQLHQRRRRRRVVGSLSVVRH